MQTTNINPDYLHNSGRDTEYLNIALAGEALTGKAQIVATYEQHLASRFGAKHAIAVSSGSTAIQAGLHCLGVQNEDEVLVPATAVLPSVFPISATGAIPVPVDVRANSLDFDPKDLARKISARTKAAMIVPLWGYPIDLTETIQILKTANIPLIEDAAHAHGATIGGRHVGIFGNLSCFSTHDKKLISTGEGGFVLTNDDAIAKAIKNFSRLENLSGEKWGVNYRFNALGAALGISRLKDLDKLLAARERNAKAILSKINDKNLISEFHVPNGGHPNYYNLVLKTDLSDAKNQVLHEAFEKIGIMNDHRRYGYDVFYKRVAYNNIKANCPNAEFLVKHLIQLPVHPNITEHDIERMVSVLNGN